jgi:acyl-CoA hydrolase
VVGKTPAETAGELVQMVLPSDANQLGFILGGTVMHLIDIVGATAAHRHTRSQLFTASVEGIEFLHPVRVGDIIIVKSRVTCVFNTSLEVQVEVFGEETLTGRRDMVTRAYVTFVTVDEEGKRRQVPPLIVETDEERRIQNEAQARRAARLKLR